jgi:hypothetical protein
MHVILQVSNLVEGESNEVEWTLSAFATLAVPLDTDSKQTNVNVAPSALTLPPLGALTMHVATVFWPADPAAESLSVKFSTPADIPQSKAQAWGLGDTTPHDFSGMFAAPFGYPRHFDRLVDPLPTDPRLLQRLEVDGRLPTPLVARRRR